MKMEADFIKAQIANLLASYPELQEDELLRRDTIEGQTDAMQLISKLVRVRNETNAQINGISEYVKELGERKSRLERRAEACRTMAFQILDAAAIPSLTLPEATLTIRPGPRAVIITDESQLPENYVRVKTEPDKQAIKQAIEGGLFVPGAELSNSQPYLAIRTK